MPSAERRRFRLAAAATLAVVALAAPAAEVPTREEWTPVERAIAGKAPEAGALLQDIVARYPKWPDGWRSLASWQWDNGQPQQCLDAAQKALACKADDHGAAALAVQALSHLGKGEEGIALAKRFTGLADPKGWVNYQAAAAALKLGKPALADEHLKVALRSAGGSVPAPFHFLSGRIALARPQMDLVGAEVSFDRARSVDARMFDAWFELGRVRLVLAEEMPQRREEYLRGAAQAFSAVVRELPDDHESWLGLGRAQLELGIIAARSGGSDAGGREFREAVSSFQRAIEKDEKNAEASLGLGEAHLRLEKWGEAAESLQRAQALGSTHRSLAFNLATALRRAGRGDEAAKVLVSNEAENGAELVTKAMAVYKAKAWEDAIVLLDRAIQAPDVQADRTLANAVRLYRGHAWLHQAEALAERAAAGGADAEALAQRREQALDAAAAAYAEAGDAGDVYARGYYLASESGRGPERAYAAGWRYLAWRSYLAPSGWAQVIANYGATGTVRQPLHYAIWGLLAFIPLVLFVKGLFSGRRNAPAAPRARPDAPADGAAPAAEGDAPRSRPGAGRRSERDATRR